MGEAKSCEALFPTAQVYRRSVAASVRPTACQTSEHRSVKQRRSISEKMPDGLQRLNAIADDLHDHHHGDG
jgi:hypothetical protein